MSSTATTGASASQNARPGVEQLERILTRFVVVVVLLGCAYASISFARPVYWRFYATVIKPFEDDPISPFDDPLIASAVAKLNAQKRAKLGLIANSSTNATGATTVKTKVEPAASATALEGIAKVGLNAIVLDAMAGVAADANPAVTVAKPFTPADWELTKERAHAAAENGYLMVTWANLHYSDFARSWVYFVKKCGLKGYMVGAMDDDMLKHLVEKGVSTWRMNTGITKNDLGWGSPNFHKMGRWKIKLIKIFLDLDVTVIISDIDTAWMKNPIPYFERFKEADILTSTDQLGPTVKDDSLERWPHAGSAMNIGIMMFRKNSIGFVEKWIELLEKSDIWDQNAFNDMIRQGSKPSGVNGLFKGYNDQLTVGILPSSIFASGHTFFVQRLYEEYKLEPYVAHATFQYSGTPGKRHRFREMLLWDDPPEYFDDPKGFITFPLHIPEDMLKASAPGDTDKMLKPEQVLPHFRLIHHQLLQIRNALAIATITGRVVVMPELWAGVDKYWAPLYAGRIPGSHFKLPFRPPMDHIFDLEGGWARSWPENEFGPDIKFREKSFMQNPRLPEERKKNKVIVEICTEPGCNAGDAPAKVQDGKVKLAANLTSDQILIALKEVQNVKFLEYPTMFNAFKNFTKEDDFKKFFNRLKHYVASFCCLEQRHPGWGWYDFWFDIPHVDRFNRQFNGTWYLKFGDGARRSMSRALLAASNFESASSCSSVEFAPEPWQQCKGPAYAPS